MVHTKKTLALEYEVTLATLRAWVKKLINSDVECPFNYAQYKSKRILPKKWAKYITDKLG